MDAVETINSADDSPDAGDPPAAPGRDLPPPSDRPTGEPVLGGVALDLAGRFRVDPLWPRLAFVVLALLDGFGVLVYFGLWLVLIVGRRPGWAAMRILGAAVLFGSVFVLDDVSGPSIDSPWWLAAVLAGVAVALWAPRGIPEPAGPVIDHALTDDRAGATVVTPAPRRREPSVLGRAILGLAVVIAAVGALIDQGNGGRLHPEQWLGAAAAVCGAGLVVGAWRGRGTWLIVPGLLFAGAGFVAGHAARAGVDSLSLGDEDVWVDRGTTGWNSTRAVGTARLAILGATDGDVARADLRVGIGAIEVDVDDEVTVEFRTTVHDGDVVVNGDARDDGTFTLGPEGAPDVIVDAEISLGDVDIERYDFTIDRDADVLRELPVLPEVPELPEITSDPAFDLGEGLRLAADGTVLLPDGLGAIGPDGELWSPYEAELRRDGVRVLVTELGDFLLLPNEMIITPNGTLIDVPAQRRELPVAVPTTVGGG